MLVKKLLAKQGVEGVATVGLGARVAEVAALLAVQPIEMVVVCRADQTIAGVVTDSDVMRRVAGCTDGSHACVVDVAEVMTRDVVTCGPDENLDPVRARMLERGLRRLPVVDAGGRFMGLVSMRTALQELYREADFEEKMLEQYFFGLGYQ